MRPCYTSSHEEAANYILIIDRVQPIIDRVQVLLYCVLRVCVNSDDVWLKVPKREQNTGTGRAMREDTTVSSLRKNCETVKGSVGARAGSWTTRVSVRVRRAIQKARRHVVH